MDIQSFVSSIATICQVLLFLTGIPTCRKIMRKGHTLDSSSFPFVAMFTASTLWLKYSLIKDLGTLIVVNGIGAALNLLFLGIFYFYTTHKSLIHKQLVVMCVLLFPPLCYVKFWATDLDVAVNNLGTVCAAVGVLTFGSPLSCMSDVIRKKSTEFMSFQLSVANFVCAILWLTYGILIGDLFVKVPNFCGLILGSFQLLLFALYGRSKSSSSSEL